MACCLMAWANVDPDHCRHMASLGYNELINYVTCSLESRKTCNMSNFIMLQMAQHFGRDIPEKKKNLQEFSFIQLSVKFVPMGIFDKIVLFVQAIAQCKKQQTSHYLIQGWLSLLKQIPLIPCLFYILSNTFWTLKHFEHIFNIWGVTNVKKVFIKCNSKYVRNVLIWPLFLEWRALEASVICQNWTSYMACSKIILGRGSANERQHYFMMPSLIGRAHTQNNLWCLQGGGQGLNIFRVWQWWVTLLNLMIFSHNTEGVVMFKEQKFGTWKYDKQVVTEFIPSTFC